MVVMERLEWKPLSEYKAPERDRLKQSAFDDLKKALEILRGAGLVHGDFRGTNVMISPDHAHAKVIDFDWAGKHGKNRYPEAINLDKVGTEWSKEVKSYGIMMHEHDQYALNDILKLVYFWHLP